MLVKNLDEVVVLIDRTCRLFRTLPYNINVLRLMFGTVAAEGLMLSAKKKVIFLRRQINGPARGLWQMEPSTAVDIYDNFLCYRKTLFLVLHHDVLQLDDPSFYVPTHSYVSLLLENNDVYACAMARIHYSRIEQPIPSGITALANYYKTFYNTKKGKSSSKKFINHYNLFGCEDAIKRVMKTYGKSDDHN